MLEVGRTLDRYVVEAELGRGGMAVVYRVRHSRLGSLHALKILSMTSQSLRKRLLQEGQVQATLRHPNVVSVTDVLDIDGHPALVMEFVEGPSLEDWLEAHRPTLDESLALFRGVVAAVEAAHAADLVHRDLKPANVLLCPMSGSFLPKVADFGLAKALAEENAGHGATRSGIAMGTPKYMAPEQIRDAGKVDKRADLFSLGCMLYELVTGEPPFDGPDILSVFNRVSSGAYVPPLRRLPQLPEAVDRAIRGCIVVDPDRRIPDCATLRRVLDGEPWAAPEVPSLAAGGAGGSMDSSETWVTPVTDEIGPLPPRSEPSEPSEPSVRGGGGTLAPLSQPGAHTTEHAPDLPGTSDAPRQDEPGRSARGAASTSRSGVSLPPGTTRRLGWTLTGALLAGAVGLGTLVVLVGGGVGGWYGLQAWHRARVAGALERLTGGEAHAGAIEVGAAGVTLREVSVDGPDGHAVIQVDRVELQADGWAWLLGAGRLEQVAIHGLDVDLRKRDGAWVVPPRTLALLTEGRAGEPRPGAEDGVHVVLGPSTLTARDADGTLRARLDGLTLTDLAHRTEGWVATGWTATGIAVDVNVPILDLARVEVSEGSARLEGLELWLRTRPDGWIDWPPVVEDGVPTWLGGTAAEGRSWLEDAATTSPAPLEALVVESGAVRLLDRAHAIEDDEVEWTVRFEQGRADREAPGQWRLTGLGDLNGARVIMDGGLDREGTLRARLDITDLPLVRLAPYLGPPLAEAGVVLAGGTAHAAVVVEEEGVDLGFTAGLELDGPLVEAGSENPDRAARRLVETWTGEADTRARTEALGRLDDPAFTPLDDFRDAAIEALLAPARSARTARRLQRQGESPVAVERAPAPQSPVPDSDSAEGSEGSRTPFEERWRRRQEQAREAIEDIRRRLPGGPRSSPGGGNR
jgi:serine/threonine protein kinase